MRDKEGKKTSSNEERGSPLSRVLPGNARTEKSREPEELSSGQ